MIITNNMQLLLKKLSVNKSF
jgi:hypothetical protein